jgi:hypothetical protein
MDPVIIAAIITSAAKVGPSIFQHFMGRTANVEKEVQKLVSAKYPELKSCLTLSLMKLLKFGEYGDYHTVQEFRKHLYPTMTFSARKKEEAFDQEFKYRLNFLVATGFFTISQGGEYYITQLGAGFLREARNQREFIDVLR